MALVLGGLQIFFLTPSQNEVSIGFQEHSKMTFSVAIKESLIKTIFHKKADYSL